MQTTFQIEGTKQQALVDGFRKVGLFEISSNEQLTEEQTTCVVDTLSPQNKQKVANGDAVISLKSMVKFQNEYGTVTSIDYDLVKVRKMRLRDLLAWDPVIIVEEKIPGILSEIVRAKLEEMIRVEIIKAAIVSIDSDAFKTSVADLARLTGEDSNETYRKCVTAIMQSCIIGMQRLDMFSEEPPEEEIQQGKEVYN